MAGAVFGTLLAFGGSGPVHAVSLGEAVGISRVVVPAMPGVLSAFGLLLAGERMDYVKSIELPLRAVDEPLLQKLQNELVSAASADLDLAGSSIEDAQIEVSLDLRYAFEPGELNLAFDGAASPLDVDALINRFTEIRLREYGFRGDGEVHCARMRMRVMTASDPALLRARATEPKTQSLDGAEAPTRSAYFNALGTISTPVLDRSAVLGSIPGPLIIEEATTTVVVAPGWSVRRDSLDNLVIERGGS